MIKKITGAIKWYFSTKDKQLILLSLVSSVYAVFLIYSATHNNSLRNTLIQIAGIGIGVVMMFIISSIDYETLASLWKIYVPAIILLFILTFFIGYTPPGSDNKAWILLPFGASLQPSELLKLAFIMTFAKHLAYLGDGVKTVRGLLSLVVHAMIPVGMVVAQGDDGSALVFIFIFIVMSFAGGVRLRYFAGAGLAAAIATPLIWFYVLSNYQRKRILAVFWPELDPTGTAYQQIQGKISIGSGQLWGRGWLQGPRTQAGRVPEQHNDFIMATAGEEFGFIGAVLILVLLFYILIRIIHAARVSRDQLGSMICMGVFATLAFQTFINLGMALSLFPVVGVTLPFFSSGGTSVMTSFMSIGLVLSVYMRQERYMFWNKRKS